MAQMKEHNKTSEKELNKVEISSLYQMQSAKH